MDKVKKMRSDIETMKGDLVQEVREILLKDRACNSDDQNNVNSNTNVRSCNFRGH